MENVKCSAITILGHSMEKISQMGININGMISMTTFTIVKSLHILIPSIGNWLKGSTVWV